MSNNSSSATHWFSQFNGFTYDQNADLRSNFARLANGRNWGRKLRLTQWVRCQTALFGSLYGTNTGKLVAWQNLCTDVGILNPPSSITACKKALGARNVLVNLVNLIEHRLSGVPVIRFTSYNAFLQYTLDGRVFPLRAAKEDGFIKALLRKVC